MERKNDDDWVKACQRLEVAGGIGRGRSKKTWRACVAGGHEGSWVRAE